MSELIIYFIIAAVSFCCGFVLSSIFAVDSYQKGYEDGMREEVDYGRK